MKDIPTPETDASWASWPYAGPGMSVHVGRSLERRLHVARDLLLKASLYVHASPVHNAKRAKLIEELHEFFEATKPQQ